MINNLQQSKFVKKIDFCHHLMSKKKVFLLFRNDTCIIKCKSYLCVLLSKFMGNVWVNTTHKSKKKTSKPHLPKKFGSFTFVVETDK